MTHRVIVRAEAEDDIADAVAWYDHRVLGLGQDFLTKVESAIAGAARNPLQYPCLRRKPEVRRVLTERFPYRVFFIRRHREVVIFRVLHSARHDREWESNIPKDSEHP
jgi:plasmid stabilization system protein ParE